MTYQEKITCAQMKVAVAALEKQVNLMHEVLHDMMTSYPGFSGPIEDCEEAVDFMMDNLTGLKEKIKSVEEVRPIRCKDCVHWMPDGNNEMVCTGAVAYKHTSKEWYCASAIEKYADTDSVKIKRCK